MAKQRNINIVYKVDTSQVKAATQQVGQAKAATDKLNQSVKATGTIAQQSNQQYKLSIGDLKGELEALRIKIEQTAVSDKKRLDELIPRYQEIKKQIDQVNTAMAGTGGASLTGSIGKVTGQLGTMYTAVRTLLVAGLIKETVNAAIEMTALAGKIAGVKKAFDKLPNSVLLMDELRRRTHGALTELELMQKALQAKNFGIPLENLGKLLEFATTKAQQTGISVQYLTDSIITGLGRESIKILDNLQIDIGLLKKRMEETGQSMRVVVGEIVNEELKKMGGYLETGETAVNQLKTAFEELKQTLSQKLEQSGFIAGLKDLITDTKNFVQGDAATRKQANVATAVAEVKQFQQANEEALKVREKSLALISQEIQMAKDRAIEYKVQISLLEQERERYVQMHSPSVQENIDAINGQIRAMRERKDVITEQVPLLEQLLKAQMVSTIEDEKKVISIESLEKEIEALTEKRDQLSVSDRAGIKVINQEIEAIERYIARLRELGVAQGSGGVPFAKEEFEKFKKQTTDFAEDNLKSDLDNLQDRFTSINKAWRKQYSQEEKDRQKARKRQAKIDQMFQSEAINAVASTLSLLNDLSGEEDNSMVKRAEDETKRVEDTYDRAIKAAGDNERAKLELELEFDQKKEELEAKRANAQKVQDAQEHQREKNQRLRQIAIDAAAGIVRALAIRPGFPEGIPYAALIAGTALAQAAVVSRLKDGVIDLKGPGTEKSDSIPAMLSKRESVMTADETKSSMGILKAIRAKRLDDKVFDKLVIKPQAQKLDFSPLAAEFSKQKYPDIVKQGATLYEVKEARKNFKVKMRSRSIH